MEEKHLYDEKQELPSPWEWVILVLFCASIMGFGWLVYLLVPDGARHWDFGQLPDAPAESIYSTDQPDLKKPPKLQIWPLPEAEPLRPLPARAAGTPEGR